MLFNMSEQNGKGQFYDKPDGRCGYIYYKEDGKICGMYYEMSGVDEYDILISFGSMQEWSEPAGVKITSLEKQMIKEQLLMWLNGKGIRAEISS